MQQRGKRMAALALAAAVCLLVPAAGANAEPWTYEVDSEMSGYGVEYYSDVGLEAPTRRADTTQSTAAGQGTAARADAGISTYSAAGEGVAVYSADAAGSAAAASSPASGYDVTIPSEITFAEDSTETTLKIEGTVQPYRVLTIDVSSANSWKLKCTENDAYEIGYALTAENGMEESTAGKKITIDNGENSTAAQVSKTLTAALTEAENNGAVSGQYTDTLTFTFDCEKKSTTVTIKYETLSSTKAISTQSGTSGYPRSPVYNDGTTTAEDVNTNTIQEEVRMTSGMTYTWNVEKYLLADGNSYDPDDWENPEVTYTATGNETGVNVIFQRKMYEFDLNVALWNADKNCYEVVASGTTLAHDWGTVDLSLPGKKGSTTVSDYYTGHARGATYTLTNITVNNDYMLDGYQINTEYGKLKDVTKDELLTAGSMITGTLSGNDKSSGSYSDGTYGYVYVWMFLTKAVSGDTLLPDTDTTTPVVTQPTDDTAADDDTTADADDTQDKAAPPTRDLSTPVVVDLPTDDTARADTGTAADTTPEELMLQDTDELLASFALSDPEELNLTE